MVEGLYEDLELTVAKDPDVIRIVFLGGSSTAGTGADLSDEDTWPWVATNELLPSVPEGKRLEFINAALGGYCTFESYGRLWSRLRAYEPDIVVVERETQQHQHITQQSQAATLKRRATDRTRRRSRSCR